MADKIVEFDPTKRLSKGAFKEIQEALSSLKYDELVSLTVIANIKDKGPSVHTYGMDFASLGSAQTILNVIAQELLREEFDLNDEEDSPT